MNHRPTADATLSLDPSWLAFAIFGAALLGIHLSYLLSAAHGHVPWCVPYWDSCASISASGRHPPAFFVFKAILLPVGGLVLGYWPLLAYWLRELSLSAHRHAGDRQAASHPIERIIALAGCGAALALILYTTLLGAVGDFYQLQRRMGIIMFFGLTGLCHLLAVRQMLRLPVPRRPDGYRIQFALSALLLGGGLFNVVLSLVLTDFGAIEDAIEWCFALVMISQFAVTGLLWRRSGFRLIAAP